MIDNNSITNKLYRYDSLLRAIDFFTQRFNFEQISEFAFEFSNEIATLNSSALFVKEGNQFILKKKRIFPIEDYKIQTSTALLNIPLFHGRIITNNFSAFFNEEDIKVFQMKVVIPLIIDSELYGFIISNGKNIGDFDEDDFHILNTLMRLFNNSLENYRYLEDLKYSNKTLDQKLFNLFVINQSTKVLLSELNIDNLAAVATDVFSEVSGSQVTTLGLYDELTGRIKIASYRNVRSFCEYVTELELKSSTFNSNRIVLEVEKDEEMIKNLFVNWEEFKILEAKYIILIVKDKILGFVTLSASMNECQYDESMFELIESLASSTYIAIDNAKMFKIINEQKEEIEKKLETLVIFNKMIRTINHSTTKDELCKLTLTTLRLHFGVEKAFIALNVGSTRYQIAHCLGLSLEGEEFEVNDHWADAIIGDTISEFVGGQTKKYFTEGSFLNQLEEGNCTVISPILVSSMEEQLPIGYLVVIESKANLKEEEALLIDTVTKNITPVLYQMDIVQSIKANYTMDRKKLFIDALTEKLEQKQLFELDFYLYYQTVTKHPFQEYDESLFLGFEHYFVGQYVFLFSYVPFMFDSFTEIKVNSLEDVINYSFE